MQKFTASLSLKDSRTMIDVLEYMQFDFEMKSQKDKNNYYFIVDVNLLSDVFHLGKTFEEYKRVNDGLKKDKKPIKETIKSKNLTFKEPIPSLRPKSKSATR